jgi:branched-chain amino acid transport system substrate-binding protein
MLAPIDALPRPIEETDAPNQRRGFKFFFRPAAQDEMFSGAIFDFLDAQRAEGKKIETVGLFFEDTIFGTDSTVSSSVIAGLYAGG